jgi:diaminohydroxyphosphoribosylaminopyrimidine deaminase/5-amino-6-(5-phosphoribosylamino)uracil reductase
MKPGAGDLEYMERAVELARRGWYDTPPNPRVGCLLVRDGEVIGEGWHARTGDAHAEVNALRDAGARAGGGRGATACVTLEPCRHYGRTAPCVDALIEAGVARVVVGARDPNPRVAGGGVEALKAAGIEVVEGVLEAECRALNPGFEMRMTAGRPRLRVKLAMSLDGRTAGADGESRWITGEAARADVHRLRAESGAVLTGIGTALADDPSLTVRLPPEEASGGEWRQPLRVVLDTRLRLPPTARMLGLPGRTLVFTAAAAGGSWDALAVAGAALRRLPEADGGLDPGAVLRALAEEEINDVLVEAGPTLAGALVGAGLADELILYVAPSLIGDGGRALMHLPGLARFADRLSLRIVDVREIGGDWRIISRTD